MSRKGSMSLAYVAVVLISAAVLFPMHRAAGSPAGNRWGADYFPNVPLTNQDGKTVHFYDDLLKDKIVAINLFYTTCEYQCPLESARLAQVQRILGDRVGKEIFFYSISIDPTRDTPEALKAYAEKFHAGPGWQFLTGKPADIELLSKKIGLYSDPKESKDGHTPALMIGNVSTGQWTRGTASDNPQFLALTIGGFLNSWNASKTQLVKNYSEAKPLTLDPGKYLFANRCAACHTIGQGDFVGPDLQGVTAIRDRKWLASYIKTPEQMLAAHDPTAQALFIKYQKKRMPNLRLGDEDVAAVIAYLEAQDATRTKPTTEHAAK
jgi:protein SCO1/2